MNLREQYILPSTAEAIKGVTGSKLRSFLYELAEGVSNYRTVHSLTEQVQHQYHGRFAIELIQNAYDALTRATVSERGKGRIKLCLVDDRDFGTLYVANDGLPFSESNFSSVSQLGQSDKNPETAIGNKGIGFRSVLEICDSPEIWSRYDVCSETFDGYCFGFSPRFVHSLFEPIMSLLEDENSQTPSTWLDTIVDWDDNLLDKFRLSLVQQAEAAGMSRQDWVRAQLGYLSPYLLPSPLPKQDNSDMIESMEAEGFATVVALPLKSEASASLVERRLAEIDTNGLLFLDKLEQLMLSTPDTGNTFSRRIIQVPSESWHACEISIEQQDSPDAEQRFYTWRREIKVVDMPKDVRKAIEALPGQWHKLSKVEITLAVSVSKKPATGQISIFLPTNLRTGAAVHVNAPFFGDMSRTDINFGDCESGLEGDAHYNRFLLDQAADLALEVIESELQGKAEIESAIVVDLLSPSPTDDDVEDLWQTSLQRAAETKNLVIKEKPWILTDKGWVALSEASILPLPKEPKVLTDDVMRQYAGFPACVSTLNTRRSALEALSNVHEIGVHPSLEDQADMIEAAAIALHDSGTTDWRGFWADVEEILSGSFELLLERKVLLGTDGQLHAGGLPGSAVFFKPRQSGQDGDDGVGEQEIDQIPQALRHRIAILDLAVPVSEVKKGRLHNTELHGALSQAGLVEPFRREDVLTKVLIPNLPDLPARRGSNEAEFCRDALSYGFLLFQSMQVRGEGQGVIQSLAKLPVPCRGGWYPLEKASFGVGWSNTTGDIVDTYLKLAKTPTAREARMCLLLPPESPEWAKMAGNLTETLREVGMHDGLRLVSIDSESWDSEFRASIRNQDLPLTGPAPIREIAWQNWRTSAIRRVASKYQNPQPYMFKGLNWLAGLEAYEEFNEKTRAAFFDAVLASSVSWPDGWGAVTVGRIRGEWHEFTLPSPLFHELSTRAWIVERLEDGSFRWSQALERWYVPGQYLRRGRGWTLEHLSPLPMEMAERLDRDEALLTFFTVLGMPSYAPDEPSNDPRLLRSLADTAEHRNYQNRDVFLGQVRSAWKAFSPETAEDFPSKIIIHKPDSTLAAIIPDPDKSVYLPHARSPLSILSRFDLPAVAIEPVDATRLSQHFSGAYKGAVRSASDLQMTPLTGDGEWVGQDCGPLAEYPGLEEALPFALTIAAHHGVNARGTSAPSFIRYMDRLRAARVAVGDDLGLVPLVDDKPVATVQKQKASWMEQDQMMLLDCEWKSEIESVADAFTQLLEREDLKFQLRKGLSEIWPEFDKETVERILAQMDLSPQHYREVFELWRGDLGPAIERLSHLMWALGRSDLSPQLDQADQLVQVESILFEAVDNSEIASRVLQAAFDAQDIFEFGSKVHSLLGNRVALSVWNREGERLGQEPLNNPHADQEFKEHRTAATPHLRRIAATLAEYKPESHDFGDIMAGVEETKCPEVLRSSAWEISFADTMRVLSEILSEFDLPEPTCAILLQVETPDILAVMLQEQGWAVTQDPFEIANCNRKQGEEFLNRFHRVAMAWHVHCAQDQSPDWLNELKFETFEAIIKADRSFYTKIWDIPTTLAHMEQWLPQLMPQALRESLKRSSSFAEIEAVLGLTSEQIDSAAEELEKARHEAERRKRMIEVCGKPFENSEANLTALFDHIAKTIKDDDLASMDGFDLKAPMIPRKTKKSSAKKRDPNGKPTRAPRRLSKSMENLVGAAGEIHAFRWLQRQYGSTVVSPSNWISAYSLKPYPENETNVDEGRGCDIQFRLEGRTYHIEIKSSESDLTSFQLGSSEVRLAKEVSQSKKRKSREVFHILKVNNALSPLPTFTLLPNPYDYRYRECFNIVEAGARVTYLP